MSPQHFCGLLIIAILIQPTLAQPCIAASSQAPALGDLDRRIMEARQLIKSGRFVVKTRRTHLVGDKGTSEVSVESVIDGDRFLEIVDRGSSKERRSFAGDYFSHLQEAHRDPLRSALVWKDAKAVDRTKSEFQIHAPLKLMMVPLPYANLGDVPSDSFIGSPLRRNVVIEHDQWDGTKGAWKVTCNIRDDAATYWVVPEWGHSIVRIDTSRESEQGTISVTLHCTPAEVAKGIWFPGSVTFEYRSGTRVFTDTSEIKLTDVNKSFPQEVFGPAAMNVPVGTPVVKVPRPKSQRHLKWTGRDIVPMSAAEVARLRGSSVQSSGGVNITYICVSIVLAGIGMFFLWRRRPQPGSSSPVNG
jgi:hypothetical protein